MAAEQSSEIHTTAAPPHRQDEEGQQRLDEGAHQCSTQARQEVPEGGTALK